MTGQGLDEFRDDPLVRALRAPGSTAELAREADYRRMYRTAFVPARRSLWGRFGAGGASVAALFALSGGVAAAAYTNVLPEPAQRIAHDVLGRIGVPSADERGNATEATASGPAAGPVEAGPDAPVEDGRPGTTEAGPSGPGAGPGDPGPGNPGHQDPRAPQTPGTPGTAGPDTDAPPTGPQPLPTPTSPPPPGQQPPGQPEGKGTPQGQPPRGPATSVELTAPSSQVAAGTTVELAGRVTDADGAGVAGRAVSLMARVQGGGWVERATATTTDTGAVTFAVRIDENTTVRLQSGPGLISPQRGIDSVPVLSASATADAVTVVVDGAFAGDRVMLYRLDGSKRVRVGQEDLDGAGRAVLAVAGKGKQGAAGAYVVEVASTQRHTAAERNVQVPA